MDFLMVKHLAGFFVVSIAAYEIALFLKRKIHFPLITGLILTGIAAGSSFLNFIPQAALDKLNFLNELALAIIAFSAGAELHLEELRSRMKSIKWMVVGQLVFTFVLSTLFVYFLSDYIPFMRDLTPVTRWSVALLFAVIFVARSPSSAVAVINEMRARGPFVKTAMGVTVVIDVLVIILFALIFAGVKTVLVGEPLDMAFILVLLLEISVSIGLGYLFGKLLQWVLRMKWNFRWKSLAVILAGYSVYLLQHLVSRYSQAAGFHFELEALLTAIVASFYVTNFTRFNHEFENILTRISPYIFIVFFTLTGDSLSLHTLLGVFGVALALFLLRIFTLVAGGIFGVKAAGDDGKFSAIAWMPYVTQAGVAIGLTTMVSAAFPSWGHEFETIIIAIIVINQLIGPPLFKWAIKYVGEAHRKGEYQGAGDSHEAVIFSLDSISMALARKLKEQDYRVRIVTTREQYNVADVDIVRTGEYSRESISRLPLGNPDSVILLYPDDKKNFEIAEWIYETIGSPNIVARLESGAYAKKFEEIGVKIIEPTAAMVNLLDHLVRAPEATDILLGKDDNQDTMDVEVRNKDLMGLRIRDLHLPQDIIILSLKRKGNTVITHGYTQLRIGDILTFVGSKKSLEEIKLRFQ